MAFLQSAKLEDEVKAAIKRGGNPSALPVSIRALPEQREYAPPSELALSARKCGSRIKKTVLGDVLLPLLDVEPEDSWLGPAFAFDGPSDLEPGLGDFSQASLEADLSRYLPVNSSRQAKAAPLQGSKLAGKSCEPQEPVTVAIRRHAGKLGADAAQRRERNVVHAKKITRQGTGLLHANPRQQRSRLSAEEAKASALRPNAHQDHSRKKVKVPAELSRPGTPKNLSAVAEDNHLRPMAVVHARRFQIDVNEVVWVLRSLQLAETCATTGKMQPVEFERFLLRALDVRYIEDHIINEACDACNASSGPLDLNKFFTWFVGNMFRVSHLTSSPEKQMSNDLVKQAAAKNDFSIVALDDVKAKFDKYDVDRSGEIECFEFEALMRDIFNIDRNLSVQPERLQRLWKELDRDGDGSVDFIEFSDWYCKYFSGAQQKDPLSAFYDSYMPLTKNKNSLLDPKAKPTLASAQRRNQLPTFFYDARRQTRKSVFAQLDPALLADVDSDDSVASN